MMKHFLLLKKKHLITLTLLLAACTGIYSYLPYFIVEVKNPLIETVRKKRIPKTIHLKQNQKKVHIYHDGLKMQGILTQSNTDSTKATIILIHGIRGNKNWWQDKSLLLADNSYQSLAIDLRAHGESEGRFTTFGVKEKDDIKAWITWLLDSQNSNHIGIWGQSLGGAVALQTLAIDQRIEFGIIESTFSDFDEICNDYAEDYLGFSVRPLTNHLINKAEKLADFKSKEANPIASCKQIKQPVFFIHGTEDKKINIAYNQANYKSILHDNKSFYKVDEAGHYNVSQIGGKPYIDTIFSFINTQIP